MYYSLAGVSQELKIFPTSGEPINIPLPFALGGLAYSPSGKTLFATDGRRPALVKRGLFRIEFNPVRVSLVPGSLDLNFDSFSVSANEDTIVFAGARPGEPCGIFELRVHSGEVRTVAHDLPCTPGEPGTHRFTHFIRGRKARHLSAKPPFRDD